MRKASRTLTARIHRLNGQLLAIESMIQAKRPCVDILNQISAVRSGVESVASILFQRELERLASKKKLTQSDLQKLISIYSKTT
jgi:DNA-binding FrmR family transcriptional regulator